METSSARSFEMNCRRCGIFKDPILVLASDCHFDVSPINNSDGRPLGPVYNIIGLRLFSMHASPLHGFDKDA